MVKSEVLSLKKSYNKPMIVFESFKLSSSIATSCQVDLDKFQEELGFSVFTSEFSCLVDGADGEFSVCYHGPENNPQLFGS